MTVKTYIIPKNSWNNPEKNDQNKVSAQKLFLNPKLVY